MRKLPLIEDADDVRMLGLRQRLRLGTMIAQNLQRTIRCIEHCRARKTVAKAPLPSGDSNSKSSIVCPTSSGGKRLLATIMVVCVCPSTFSSRLSSSAREGKR